MQSNTAGFTCTILPNGNLKITADNSARRWITDNKDRGSDNLLWDSLECYWSNGSYHPFDAGDANPFIGLTDAPCIAESMDMDDDGKYSIVGRFWYFPDYCITDPMEELRLRGAVVFQLGE